MNGICFKEPLFHATIEGRKTQTRRICQLQPPTLNVKFKVTRCESTDGGQTFHYDTAGYAFCPGMTPRYKVGDVLYLKEPYARSYIPEMGDKYENPLQASCDPKCWETIYKFDGGVLVGDDGPVEWKNKLFMPEWAARHFIRITAVRAERLQDVSDEDCFREGVIKTSDHFYGIKLGESFYQGADDTPRETYAALIDQINGRGTWDSNPFVWVYDYELTEKP